MSRRSFRFALVFVLASFAALAAAGVWAGRLALSYPGRRHGGAGREITVTVRQGMNLEQVSAELARAGVIDHPTWFRLYAMNRGMSSRLRAGTYTLRDDLAPRAVLDLLVQGVHELDIAVTIPEGRNLLEVVALLGKAGVGDPAALEAVARDPLWLKEQGIEGETAEGYLFPDTYRFKKNTPAKAVLEALVRRHRIVFEEVMRENGRSARKLKRQLEWTDRDLVTLASIVEKETADPAERPRVASVFVNRLTFPTFKSRRLETDPTIRYGCTVPTVKSKDCQEWDPAGRLHRAQLDDEDNPYNTYRHPGLPPGPISNPGRASLTAVTSPEKTDFLYFVAKDERSHVFSKSYEEHQRWVEKYQR